MKVSEKPQNKQIASSGKVNFIGSSSGESLWNLTDRQLRTLLLTNRYIIKHKKQINREKPDPQEILLLQQGAHLPVLLCRREHFDGKGEKPKRLGVLVNWV